jgi:photosystem II stability/assembly factor-like uncharacterized protein
MYKRFLSPHTVFILLCLLFSGAVAGCKGKMTSPKPLPNPFKVTAANLYDVATIGENHIWVVGNYGAIHHSMDGGKTWSRQNSGTENLLCSVKFVDEKTGWISGTYGTLLHTEDGGNNWVSQNPGTQEHLFCLYFLNKDLGWVVGRMGTLLHTSDGGKTWRAQREKEDVNLQGVCFLDEKTGWVVGEFGTIIHTRDGGKTWIRQKPKTLFAQEGNIWADTVLALYGVKFIDQNRGWIVGMGGVILRTEDGGKNWMDLRGTYNVTDPLYHVEINGSRGWIVGKAGAYLFSEDGGKTWRLIEDKIKTRFWLMSVTFSTPDKGWVVGERGAVVKTEDGGKTWTMLSGLSYDVPEFGLTDF